MRGVQRGEPLCRESEGQKQVLPLPARNKAEGIAEGDIQHPAIRRGRWIERRQTN